MAKYSEPSRDQEELVLGYLEGISSRVFQDDSLIEEFALKHCVKLS